MRRFSQLTGILLVLALLFSVFSGCNAAPMDAPIGSAVLAESTVSASELPDDATPAPVSEEGKYTTAEDVALYLHLYGHLPENFITKKDARSLGWNGGGLDGFADGKCIGGDRFGNYEGLLPDAAGRAYYECDIGTMHASSRGAKRIVYSNDGLIYYTEDHYESFTLLYGEE